MTIYLVRHGETEWSKAGRHTGTTDLSLTERGRKQALAVGKGLQGISFSKVYTSPLKRARETCALAGFGERAEILSDLAEWNYGLYEGKTSEEIHCEHPDWNIFKDGAPQGESVGDVEKRVARLLAQIDSARGPIILFASGHILRSFAVKWLQLDLSWGRALALSPASLSILGFEHQNRAILLWNSPLAN